MARRSFNNKKDSGGDGGTPGWMVTFADLMSLLLTFFILLFSMSNVDSEKFDTAAQSIQGAFGGSGIFDKNGKMLVSADEDGNLKIDAKQEDIENMHSRVSKYLSSKNLNNEVSVNIDEKGVYFDIKEAVLFDSGSAEIKESGMRVLKELAGLIRDINNEIMIEGHTDNIPINNNKYSSNWELSTARAISVVKYFTEIEKITPGRMAAVGYGEYNPIVANDTEKNRAANRRVNLLIIFEEGEGIEDGREE